MVLNATSPEHLVQMIVANTGTFREWLVDRLSRDDDDSDDITMRLEWLMEMNTVSAYQGQQLHDRLHALLLRDCQERIAQYLSEDYAEEEIEDVCA
jgi:hypothetical protein